MLGLKRNFKVVVFLRTLVSTYMVITVNGVLECLLQYRWDDYFYWSV